MRCRRLAVEPLEKRTLLAADVAAETMIQDPLPEMLDFQAGEYAREVAAQGHGQEIKRTFYAKSKEPPSGERLT